jgi:hypothetical protein
MKQEVIMATTHIDLHYERFTRNALEQMNEIINGEAKPLVTYDHDMAIPPAGKLLESRIELREDGEYQLVATQEYFEEIQWGILEDGTKVFKQESVTDRHPFSNKYEQISDEFAVSFDGINFESKEAMRSFIQEIEEQSGTDFEAGMHGRKSLIPDPEFIVQLSKVITGYLLTKKVIDKVGDKVAELIAEDVAKFYSFARSVIITAAKYARPKGRPITYIFVAPGNPSIEFIARSTDPDVVVNAMLLEKLEGSLSKADYLNKKLGAVRIQYLLNEKGEWEFNYLLTDNGAVIGTEQSLVRRAKRAELMIKEIEARDNAKLPD